MQELILPKQLLWAAKTTHKEAKSFARKHKQIGNPRDLLGYCAIASYMLQRIAATKGIHVDFVFGKYSSVALDPCELGFENHCWCVYNNTHIIDLTASQFYTMGKFLNSDGFYIGLEGDRMSSAPYYNRCANVSNWAALSEVNENWLAEQKPSSYHEYLNWRISKYDTNKHKQIPRMESNMVSRLENTVQHLAL